jgi:MFS family permease
VTEMDDPIIKKSTIEPFKLSLDRLSVCFNEPNEESVKKTVGLLISDHITKYIPGIVVTANARYFASCRFLLPSGSNDDDAKICFEAGPRRPGQPSFRLDFNPSKFSAAAGVAELMSHLECWIAKDPTIALYSGKITRCDAAIDCPGYRNDEVIIRSRRFQQVPSPWSPFRHPIFAVIWAATVVSNIGGWMYSAASGWLMTGLNPDPLIVSLVQVATTLPIFLFAIPAGALADIVDMRRFLIVGELSILIASTAFAAIVWFDLATPVNLLVFTFLEGAASALTSPAWQAAVPKLVPKQDLNPAVAANSAGINVSRAVGPALGGVMVAQNGIAAPFWFNAFSNAGVIGALLWWHPPRGGMWHLPAERFQGAIRIGFRHARNNPHLRATLIRSVSFFLFASAYWALLPLVTRSQIAVGPDLYGYLLGTIGASAVGAALALPWLQWLYQRASLLEHPGLQS